MMTFNEPDRVKIPSSVRSVAPRPTLKYIDFIAVMAIQQENILGDVRRTSTWAQKTLSLVFGSPSEQFCPKITFSMVVSKRHPAETCLIRCFPLKMIYSMHLMWLGEVPEYISDVCSTKNLLLNLLRPGHANDHVVNYVAKVPNFARVQCRE